MKTLERRIARLEKAPIPYRVLRSALDDYRLRNKIPKNKRVAQTIRELDEVIKEIRSTIPVSAKKVRKEAFRSAVLDPEWTFFKYHKEQSRLWNSPALFKMVPAGRRSGKTAMAKRWVIHCALNTTLPDARYICAAPTYQQAKDIFWDDLKALIPSKFVADIYESELTIKVITGAVICVRGMDKPMRVEGKPLDGIVLDEYGNMKPTVWEENILPALGTPGRPMGWAWFIGVPEGRNHYYKLYKKAQNPKSKEWDTFHWISADIMDPERIAMYRRTMDPLTYAQEMEGSFINYQGRIYYVFSAEKHARETLPYHPGKPIAFCFDFNAEPGVAAILQEQRYEGNRLEVAEQITGVIGEVWIEKNSVTPMVCRRLIKDWGDHQGEVHIYGDATGGAKGSAKTEGSDWVLVRKMLKPHFQDRLKWRVPKGNPSERARVNTVNSRLESMDGMIHMLVDPNKAPHVIEDFEGVIGVKGGSGEILKEPESPLTHISDAIGYYTNKKHPLVDQSMVIQAGAY